MLADVAKAAAFAGSLCVAGLVVYGSPLRSETRVEVGPSATGAVAAADSVRACDLLDLGLAESILGDDTEHPGGDMERETCLYSHPGVAMLTIQIGRAQFYDQFRILEPYTETTIGDRARYNEQPNGATAVQFAKGEHSVTISVQPIGTARSSYLGALLRTAEVVADRLP